MVVSPIGWVPVLRNTTAGRFTGWETSDFKEYRADGKGGSSANKTKSSLCRDLTNGAWAFPLEFIGR
ncbi:MAG: hypothetical protein CMJ50_03600 [Planctomycetaceae bacterium]|nr:hypothetical protein [Planctomycetaceae bacterium]